jgi:hypothetical protein
VKLYGKALFVLFFIANPVLALEEYFTVPGARAMGMAGAFSAIATDASGIWYNPAGLALTDQADVTVEYGDVVTAKHTPTFNNSGVGDFLETDKTLKYAGIRNNGFSAAYFKPYDFFTDAVDAGNPIKVHTTYEEFMLGYGHSVTPQISLGGSVSYAKQTAECFTTGCSGDASDGSGVGFSLGGMGNWNVNNIHYSLGVNYRSSITTDTELVVNNGANVLTDLPGRPQSLSISAATNFPLYQGENAVFLIIAAQYDHLKYDDIIYRYFYFSTMRTAVVNLNESRYSLGSELQLASGNGWDLFVRAGLSATYIEGENSVGSNTEKPYPDEIRSQTTGLGFSWNDIVVDLGVERRNVIASGFFSDTKDESETLMSLSLSRVF